MAQIPKKAFKTTCREFVLVTVYLDVLSSKRVPSTRKESVLGYFVAHSAAAPVVTERGKEIRGGPIEKKFLTDGVLLKPFQAI